MPLRVLSVHLLPPLHCCDPLWTPCWGHAKMKPADNEPDNKMGRFCWIRLFHQITEEFHLLKSEEWEHVATSRDSWRVNGVMGFH